jgi:hypothetical protein
MLSLSCFVSFLSRWPIACAHGLWGETRVPRCRWHIGRRTGHTPSRPGDVAQLWLACIASEIQIAGPFKPEPISETDARRSAFPSRHSRPTNEAAVRDGLSGLHLTRWYRGAGHNGRRLQRMNRDCSGGKLLSWHGQLAIAPHPHAIL